MQIFKGSNMSFIKKILAEVKYEFREEVEKDILNTTKLYVGLKLVSDKFVFLYGSEKTLAKLVGTIPIRFKGKGYHIPVEIWMRQSHPKDAPMVFVKPADNMSIIFSQNVDPSGKVFLSYLNDWKYPNNADLTRLIQTLEFTFSENPPVCMKTSSATPTRSGPNRGHTILVHGFTQQELPQPKWQHGAPKGIKKDMGRCYGYC